MNPWMSEAVADEHRQELIRVAGRHLPASAGRQELGQASHTSWDARLGWMLIRVGSRLVAQRAQLPQA
jgi:hypothetical protein